MDQSKENIKTSKQLLMVRMGQDEVFDTPTHHSEQYRRHHTSMTAGFN